jgi:signal transduction histidine kinase
MFEDSAGLWLGAGNQPIRVRYFNRTGDRGLEVYIAGPGMPRERVPQSMLCHIVTNAATGALSWTSGLTFKCYQGDWTVLPDFSVMTPSFEGVVSNFDIGISGRADDFGLQFDGLVDIPRPGFYVLSCASDDGSVLEMGEVGATIRPAGALALPDLPRLAAGQLVKDNVDPFCAILEGVATFVVRDAEGLRLELSSGRGRAEVQLLSPLNAEPEWLIGARVSARGVCESVFTPEGYKVAGKLSFCSAENLQVLDLPKRFWDLQPVLSAGQVRERLAAGHEPVLVRVQGILETNIAGGRARIRGDSGDMYLTGSDALQFQAGTLVEALGVAEPENSQPTMQCYAVRNALAETGSATNQLRLLSTVEATKQMSRDEANLGYPVKVRGVITFVWPDAGFFLQDGTWSIDVRMATNLTKRFPSIGEYWEVEGKTFAAFAPDILATHATRLGEGTLPEPVHPIWTQLLDGSMDTQYIEVEGVVLSVQGSIFNLLTRGGRLKVNLPEDSDLMLAKFQGARVRVRGCLIPGRDPTTQQVKLGEFDLRNASVCVDEPAPADPFALPLKHATDLLLFDSHASQIQRTKIQGVVLQQRDGVAFLMDRSNGVRVVAESATNLLPGDAIEAVGFPDLNGPSPVFNNALVRLLSHASLPPAAPLPVDRLLDGHYDSTRVAIEGTLLSQRNSGVDQIFEMRTGPRLWFALLPVPAGALPELALGSSLKLTGVYAGEGGDRTRGRDLDSFELLLDSPRDVLVVRSPSWWTARHAVGVAGALLAVLLLAAIWIGALRRRVEERTRALKSEIEDHKHTELELEEKTRMLTREIEERLRSEAEVERGHKQLLVTSRLAGMAEVATSVLHNVGNVMTSVNVLSDSIAGLVRDSKISSVARLGTLLSENQKDLNRFITEDERGRKIPDYVGQLGAHLADEHALLLSKVKVLNENIHHINEIVAMQQNFAKVSAMLETLPPEEVAEDALRMHGESLKRHGIQLVREFEKIPPVTMDRHQVLQILFNLLENAKYACLQDGAPGKKIVMSLKRTVTGHVRLTVSDNGMGIPPENLARIFGQGFSTRKDGHGFGLHSSILAAQDMGGTLTAQSEGQGKGAVFTLEIPLVLRREPPPKRN